MVYGLPIRSVAAFPCLVHNVTNHIQTVNNACASVALLNIVINVPGIELGNIIQEFKSFTADFSPALRGDAVANFEFVKKIHNAFAR